MMLKLKIAALKAREGEAKGEVQGPEADQVQQLEKELAIQRRLAEFNPDVVRFKMELDSCKGMCGACTCRPSISSNPILGNSLRLGITSQELLAPAGAS